MVNNTKTYCYTEEDMQQVASRAESYRQQLMSMEKILWAVVLASGGKVEVPDIYFQDNQGTLTREENMERHTIVFKATTEKR